MTARETIALMALQAELTKFGIPENEEDMLRIAKLAFKMADAMMSINSKKNTQELDKS